MFNGSIDGVKIYNRALSAEEVRYHYNRGGPVAHWKMDEGEGAKAYDESGNRNHGTLTGSTSGTADSGSATTLVDTTLTQAEDFWKDYTLKIVTTTDALAPQGETATITGFAAGTDTLSFAALTAVVDTDDTYKLYYGDEDGPTWVAGKHFGSLSFDGTDDYIDCGNDSSLDITDAITISAWVKVNGVDDGGYIVTKSEYNASGGYALYWVGNSNVLRFFNGNVGNVDSSVVFSDSNVWVYITMKKNASNNITFYRNGVMAGTGNLAISSNSYDCYIGSRSNTVDQANFFNGAIDGVKIYNYARTPAQILIDYNAGRGTHIK
jgi:hypothetical protein